MKPLKMGRRSFPLHILWKFVAFENGSCSLGNGSNIWAKSRCSPFPKGFLPIPPFPKDSPSLCQIVQTRCLPFLLCDSKPCNVGIDVVESQFIASVIDLMTYDSFSFILCKLFAPTLLGCQTERSDRKFEQWSSMHSNATLRRVIKNA